MTDRPKFEDYVNGPEGWTGDLVEVAADAWKACADAYEPIIAGLEKKLAEARAEIAGAYFAAANVCQDALKQMEHHALCKPERILALTPESARQAMEQRIAEAADTERENICRWLEGDRTWPDQRIIADDIRAMSADAKALIAANRAKAEGVKHD